MSSFHDQNQPEDLSPSAPRDRTELFVSLLGQSEAQVHAHILTLLPNWADADDVLQRTNIILWRKFDQWRPEQNFTAWACGVARLEVKNFLRTKARDRHYFDEALVDALGETLADVTKRGGEFGNQLEALRQCLGKLRPKDREIIERCYSQQQVTAKEVAEQLRQPVNTVYKALIRIRRALFECVQRALAAEGRI